MSLHEVSPLDPVADDHPGGGALSTLPGASPYERMKVADGLGIVVREQGTTTTITLLGEWDMSEQAAAREAIAMALKRFPECVVLDLSRLSFIDSTGIHGVVELHKRASEQNVRFVIVPGPRAVQRPFEICRLTELLPFVKASA